MGRYLLDGRKPQSYKGAFGRVGQGCRKRMFKLIDEGVAFKHADSFLDKLCDFLVRDFHIA
ncbi:hypothetical protein L210DRAFT_3561434 [Boletus edulis BED1]|uniref:Uncharacterized protein n=1 Tax=Boletus edulis BED1 TaxID=1328754 RepID=A0AAD4G8Q6_BOLED|nr:hypothetical protein L210DRAFT_3561434 [Boletus edulis BED1]